MGSGSGNAAYIQSPPLPARPLPSPPCPSASPLSFPSSLLPPWGPLPFYQFRTDGLSLQGSLGPCKLLMGHCPCPSAISLAYGTWTSAVGRRCRRSCLRLRAPDILTRIPDSDSDAGAGRPVDAAGHVLVCARPTPGRRWAGARGRRWCRSRCGGSRCPGWSWGSPAGVRAGVACVCIRVCVCEKEVGLKGEVGK